MLRQASKRGRNRRHTITSRPEMVPPVRFLLKPGVTLEHFDCCLSFECPYDFRDGQSRRYLQHCMHMIRLHIQLQHFDFLPFTQRPQRFIHKLRYIASQHPKSIFWAPHQVIFALINAMGLFFPLRHSHMLQHLRHFRQSRLYMTTC